MTTEELKLFETLAVLKVRDAKLQKRVEELERELNEHRDGLSELNAKCIELRRELDEYKSFCVTNHQPEMELRRQLDEAYETIKANNYQLSIHKKRIAELEAQVRDMNKITTVRERERTDLILELNETYAKIRGMSEIYEKRIIELEAELAVAQSAVQALVEDQAGESI